MRGTYRAPYARKPVRRRNGDAPEQGQGAKGPAKGRRRKGEVTQVVTLSAPNAQDCVALAEIELCGELMIAASTAREERLSPDRIDEVLNVGDELLGAGSGGGGGSAGGAGSGGSGDESGGGDVDGVLAAKGAEAWTTVPRQAAHQG